MLISHILGGLGNQMFQYAFGRSLSLSLGTELKLDISDFKHYPLHQGFELSRIFGISTKIASEKDFQLVLGWRGASFIRKNLRHRYLNNLRDVHYVVEPGFFYWPGVCDVDPNSYLVGYWQSEKYFSSINEVIRAEFIFKEVLSPINLQLAQLISGSNSVSLHVRRGDYATDPIANVVHGLCDLSYYSRAVNYIASFYDSPVFYVFSDDISWAKENLKISFSCIYVEHNIGENSYNDMRLMSLCKHHIVANSSFSWWGAWLNQNPDKVIIAPQKWFCNDLDDRDLMPSQWIRM